MFHSHDGGSCKRPLRISFVWWNMRTYFYWCVQVSGRGVVVDRKAMLIVRELRRFGMSVVGISETKRFVSAVYDVDRYLILHSGRALTGDGEKEEWNEGVSIVLDPGIADGWRQGGEQWKPASSRIVTARLKLCEKAAGKSRTRSGPVYGVVVSVYALSRRACQADKDKFYSALWSVVDDVSGEDVLLIVGDYLNARVGSGKDGGDEWDAVRSRHGVGQRNEAGEVLLS